MTASRYSGWHFSKPSKPRQMNNEVSKIRQSNMELLRIIAMFLDVVTLHIALLHTVCHESAATVFEVQDSKQVHQLGCSQFVCRISATRQSPHLFPLCRFLCRSIPPDRQPCILVLHLGIFDSDLYRSHPRGPIPHRILEASMEKVNRPLVHDIFPKSSERMNSPICFLLSAAKPRIQLASANIRNLFIKALSWC